MQQEITPLSVLQPIDNKQITKRPVPNLIAASNIVKQYPSAKEIKHRRITEQQTLNNNE